MAESARRSFERLHVDRVCASPARRPRRSRCRGGCERGESADRQDLVTFDAPNRTGSSAAECCGQARYSLSLSAPNERSNLATARLHVSCDALLGSSSMRARLQAVGEEVQRSAAFLRTRRHRRRRAREGRHRGPRSLRLPSRRATRTPARRWNCPPRGSSSSAASAARAGPRGRGAVEEPAASGSVGAATAVAAATTATCGEGSFVVARLSWHELRTTDTRTFKTHRARYREAPTTE